MLEFYLVVEYLTYEPRASFFVCIEDLPSAGVIS